MDLYNAIRDIVHAILAKEPSVKVMYGTYTGSAMRIDALPLDLPMEMIDIPPALQKLEAKLTCTLTEGEGVSISGSGSVREIALTDVPVTLTRALEPGDHVTLVRHYGGQRFTVLEKL